MENRDIGLIRRLLGVIFFFISVFFLFLFYILGEEVFSTPFPEDVGPSPITQAIGIEGILLLFLVIGFASFVSGFQAKRRARQPGKYSYEISVFSGTGGR